MPDTITAPAPEPKQAAAPQAAPVAAKPAAPAPTTLEPSKAAPTKSMFDEIDELAAKPNETVKPVEKKADAPKVEPEKGRVETEKKADSIAKPEEKLPEKKGDLAKLYTERGETIKRLNNELHQLKTAKPAEDTDKPKLVESLTTAQKRIKELEDTIKYANYELSDEFKEKYQKPYEHASTSAESRVVQLKVQDGNGGNRNVTKEEFWNIVRMGDENDALAAAEALFGEGSTKANFVIERRNEVLSAWNNSVKAKEEFQRTAKERADKEAEQQTMTRAQSETHRKEMDAAFQKLNEERIAAKPEYNKAEDGDETGASLLNMGSALGDLAFGALTEDRYEHLPENVKQAVIANKGQLPPQELVKLHSAMRAAMRERPFIAYKLHNAEKKIAELQSDLDAYSDSEPNKRGGTGKEKAAALPTIEQEIMEAAAKNHRR